MQEHIDSSDSCIATVTKHSHKLNLLKIPFVEYVLQIRGRFHDTKFGHAFGIVNPSPKHLREIGHKRPQVLGEWSVEAVVHENEVDEAIVQDNWFLR